MFISLSNVNICDIFICRQRSPEKSLESSLSRLSVKDGRPMHLSEEQVNTLKDVAVEPSAMDKYLAMKTKQDLDSISCSH